jgi:uncharacterized membrane protein
MLTVAIAITTFTVIFVHILDRLKAGWIRTLLDWFPSILFAYVVPASICYLLNLDLSGVQLHQWSRDLIMPLAILTVMGALSFSQLKVIGIRPIIVFVGGSLVIASAPLLILAYAKFFNADLSALLIDESYWKGLIPLVGAWIGGSTSQLVLKEIVACPENIFVAILILDNILVNIWTILMFQTIKRSDQWNRVLRINDQIPDFVPDEIPKGEKKSIWYTAIACILIIILTHFLIQSFLFKILLLSGIGLLLGNLVKNWSHAFVLKVGGYLIILIMAILGLRLTFDAFSLPPSIILACIMWILAHFLVMLALAKVLNLHIAWVPIASMANVGGISTAPAVTAAFNEEWMPHAIILAILSMVTGTSWGLFTIYLLRLSFGVV